MIYLFFVIISAFTSEYSRTAWLGTYDRSEGALMWIAYFVIFFAAMYFAREIDNAKFILYGLAFSSIIMGAIGVSQFIGRDFFGTAFARWLITITGDDEVLRIRQYLAPTFTIANGTLFNPNTFGKYTAMLSPVLLLAALTFDGKNGKKYVNLILLFAGGLMLLGVFGSSSLGGLIGIVTAVGVLVITYACRPGIPWKRLAIAAGPVILALALAILFIPPLNYRVSFLFNRMGDAMRAETTSIQNYIFEENVMTVHGEDGEMFSLTVNEPSGNWLTVRDANGNEIPPASRITPPPQAAGSTGALPSEMLPTVYTFDIPNYRVVEIEKYGHFFVYYHVTPMPFILTFENERIYGITPSLNRLIDLHEEIPAWGFYGRETWGSSRGYIWSRSFPLMPSRTIIGSGPDTFINAFPKDEMVSRQRFFNNPYQIVDKAHNIFIQIWVSTGGISAIALLALFGHYLFTTFRSLIKSKGEPLFSYGLRLGLLCGISAYCMSSMATDTTIGSTGVFFVLLGVGYGLNYHCNKTDNKTKQAA